MKLADFQKYLHALADVLAAARGPSKELTEAANALTPFAHQTMAEFAAFLKLAETTYFATGQLPIAPPKAPRLARSPKPPKAEKVSLEQLQAAIQDVRNRLDGRVQLTRAGVRDELARFESLPKTALDTVVSGLGYEKKAASKKAAVEMIVDRLLAGAIAEARSNI